VPIGFDVLNSVTTALRKAATSSLIVQTGSQTANNHSHYFLMRLEWWARQAQTECPHDTAYWPNARDIVAAVTIAAALAVNSAVMVQSGWHTVTYECCCFLKKEFWWARQGLNL